MGFSQGACLALEFTARHARRYAAVVAFSGGLIGYFGFGDLPDRWTWIGIAIVVGSGAYVLLREERAGPSSSGPTL